MPLLFPLYYREVHGTLYSTYRQQTKKNRTTILGSLPQEILFQTLLNNYADAVHTLQTPLLYEKLTLSQRVLIIEAHEPLALRIFDDMQKSGHLNSLMMARLGKNHLSIANKILNTPDLCNQLEGIHLAVLGQKIPEIAEYIYSTDELARHLKGKHWAILAQNHYSLAKKILNNKQLLSKLDAYYLILMSRDRIETAKYIYDKSETFNKLDSNIAYSAIFCSNHLELADGFLYEHQSILGGALLAILGQNFAQIANKILDIPQLCSELNSANLSMLGKNTEVIGRRILEAKAAPREHPNLNLNELIGPLLADLGTNFVDNAWYILKNKQLCSELYGSGLAQLGKKLPEIAHYIIQTETLASQLADVDLLEISQENPEVAIYILKNKSLREKLNTQQEKQLLYTIEGKALLTRIFSLNPTNDDIQKNHAPEKKLNSPRL